MSRPRKPYGPNPPGRLFGTMIKVLAAEMSDQGRLSRGKRYWSDEAVVDIVVGHGAVTAEVQGSRAAPYVVTIEADPGDGVPGRREIWAQCTCPDDTGTGTDLCKHAVAAFFALADEIATEPELIERWRSGRGPAHRRDADRSRAVDDAPGRLADVDDVVTRVDFGTGAMDDDRAGSGGRDDVGEVVELRRGLADTEADEIARLLAPPQGASPPTFAPVTELDHGPIRDRRLADVLDDCLDHLGIRWE